MGAPGLSHLCLISGQNFLARFADWFIMPVTTEDTLVKGLVAGGWEFGNQIPIKSSNSPVKQVLLLFPYYR